MSESGGQSRAERIHPAGAWMVRGEGWAGCKPFAPPHPPTPHPATRWMWWLSRVGARGVQNGRDGPIRSDIAFISAEVQHAAFIYGQCVLPTVQRIVRGFV